MRRKYGRNKIYKLCKEKKIENGDDKNKGNYKNNDIKNTGIYKEKIKTQKKVHEVEYRYKKKRNI